MWGRLTSEAKFTMFWLKEFYIKDCFKSEELPIEWVALYRKQDKQGIVDKQMWHLHHYHNADHILYFLKVYLSRKLVKCEAVLREQHLLYFFRDHIKQL